MITIKLKKHSENDVQNIAKLLDLICTAHAISSEYGHLLEKSFNVSEHWITKYDEPFEDITALFVENRGFREMYGDLGNQGIITFFDVPEYKGFVMDVISDYIYGMKEISGLDKYKALMELFCTAKYLYTNPLPKNTRIGKDYIETAKQAAWAESMTELQAKQIAELTKEISQLRGRGFVLGENYPDIEVLQKDMVTMKKNVGVLLAAINPLVDAIPSLKEAKDMVMSGCVDVKA